MRSGASSGECDVSAGFGAVVKKDYFVPLGDVTDLLGKALKDIADQGVEMDERTVRLLVDRFMDKFKAYAEHRGVER